VGHEFRTPLNGILGYSETMERLIQRADYDNLTRCADTVREAAAHLAQLVEDVMDISAIEGNRVDLCLTPIAPGNLCSQISAHCSPEAEGKGLRLEFNVPDGLPSICADHTRMAQVLTNLVHNALKFTDQGGVSVSARHCESDECVEFMVADTGPGIARQDQQRIFERFERLDTSGAKRGSGLGLAISRKLVDAHGGRIWVESEPGRGSVFHFTVPVVTERSVLTE
jgi:signal transduction histidine kinase